jgi:hypothetical protein
VVEPRPRSSRCRRRGREIDDARAGARQVDDAGRDAVVALGDPLHAEIGALVDVDFDDDRLDLDLRAADVELVDDRHQDFMIFGGAVMISALVGTSAQMRDAGIDVR